MKNLPDLYLAVASAAFYLLAALFTGFDFLTPRRGLRRLALTLVAVGFASHTGALVSRGILSRSIPLTDLFEYTLFMSWAIALAYLAIFRARLPRSVAIAVFAVLFMLLGASSLFYYTSPFGGKMPALRSYWLYIHVSLAALGETFFAIAFVASLIYLYKAGTSARSGLDTLDALAYRAITIGFPLFTAGALVAGAIWAKQAWGAYWSWDPKEVLSLVVWLVYAAYLHARLVRDLRGTPAAVISVAGFLLTLFTIFSTLVFGGLHAYG